MNQYCFSEVLGFHVSFFETTTDLRENRPAPFFGGERVCSNWNDIPFFSLHPYSSIDVFIQTMTIRYLKFEKLYQNTKYKIWTISTLTKSLNKIISWEAFTPLPQKKENTLFLRMNNKYIMKEWGEFLR